MPPRQAVLRALLLLLTALGVAGMHTMGHLSDSHCVSATATAAEFRSGTTAHAPPPSDVSMALTRVALPEPGRGLDPSDVCVAVLVLGGLAILVAAALHAGRRATAGGTPVHTIPSGTGPGPPQWPPIGLALAGLSVVRT